MQIHELKAFHKKKSRKRVGRGGKRGTYSGKGVKGQNARAGRKFQPAIRELIKRYPKLRGYRFTVSSSKSQITILNLEDLEKNFSQGDKVTPEALLEKKIIRRIKGKVPVVKILGEGNITKSLNIENCLVSKQAKEKIEKADGLVK